MQAKGFRSLDVLSDRVHTPCRSLGCTPSSKIGACRRGLHLQHSPPQGTSVQGSAASLMRGEDSTDDSFPMSVPMGYEAQELDAARQVDREDGLKQYEDLKQHMVARTRRFGVLLSGYLLLQVSPTAGLAALIGTAGSWLYLQLLINDMGNVSENGIAAFRQAQAQPAGPGRTLLLGIAAYRQALKARLLVPVCLAAGMALYNSQAEKPVGGAEEFSLLGGFLSYKAALLLELWDAIKPTFDPADVGRQPRPELPVLPEVEPLALPRREESE